MGSRKILGQALLGLTMLFGTSAAHAQAVSDNLVAEKRDWGVHEAADPKECWAVTTFKESVNTRNGAVVAVRRTQTLLMVFVRPSVGGNAMVGFTGGYPFKSGSTVELKVDDEVFNLFTEGEWAWPESEAEDAKIIAAMKRGTKAVAVGESGRGTRTQDTFSLFGVTAAIDEATKRCAS